MNNTRIWDALSKTDPKHTKPFKRAGGFQGTAVKPIWLIKRLTEQFGPAGHFWGMEKPEFQTVAANDEILVYCTVALWYMDSGQRGTVYGVGGDKVMGKNKFGPFTNDEAFKASYTDALSNAMKQIGVAADIHMGLFDDEKYVREAQREFSAPFAGDTLGQARQEAIDSGMTNGETRSTYQIAHENKSAGRLAAELWASNVLEALKSPGFDTLAFKDWKLQPCTNKGTKTNAHRLDEMREKHPDLADKIDVAADKLPLAAA